MSGIHVDMPGTINLSDTFLPYDMHTPPPTPTMNTSSTAFVDVSRDEQLVRVEIGVQTVIFLLAICGNILVLLALRFRKKKTSRWHWFIMHLSIADLLVAVGNILPQLAWDITFRFQGSDAVCRIVKYMQLVVLYLSTYTLVMTAVDRHHAICIPTAPSSPRRVRAMISVAWILALVLSLPQLFIFQLTEIHPGSGVYDCWAHFQPEWTLQLYITAFGLCVYIIPFFILLTLYGRICYKVWTNLGYKENGASPHPCGVVYKFNGTGHISVIGQSDNTRNTTNTIVNTCDLKGVGGKVSSRKMYSGISRTKMKTIKLTFVVCVAYLVCWSPFIITQMWWAYDVNAPYNSSTFVICLLLASLNSCCNPWIYMCFSGNLVRQIICKERRTRRVAREPAKDEHRAPARIPPMARQHHQRDARPQSTVLQTKPTDVLHDQNDSEKELFEMKVKTNKDVGDKHCDGKGTRAHFNANDYPCVLYRPLQTDQVTVKFHSV